jgi:hypothetical protein
MELPMSAKSKIDIDDPKRLNPITLTMLLSRPNDRKLRLLPRCRKSSTARPLPRRAKLRSETALPI